ncbi:MAG: hypothetical protein KJP13_04755 [Altererythrobacter sp.]|nr:hypothetical protein [Altererythrobacter sp.]
MRILVIVTVVIVAVLSLAAGGAKLASMPQEVQFFENAGVSIAFLIPLGGLQVAGGLLTVIKRTRPIGSLLSAACFLVSAVMIFGSGNIGFGFVSLLPVALSALLYSYTKRSTNLPV